MITLYVICEGETEANFIKWPLANYFANKIILIPITLPTGWDGGNQKKGGGRSYAQWKHRIIELMKQKKQGFYTSFFDLYGMPSDIPCKEKLANLSDPFSKAKLCEEQFMADMQIERYTFFPHVQPYEFEALLFVIPESTSKLLSDDPSVQPKLANHISDIKNQFPTPEHINDSVETAPSKRLIALQSRYSNLKTLAWRELSNIDKIRCECTHFDQWLKKIESIEVS